MSFTEVMFRVLPPVNGQQPHITGHYGEQRTKGPHGGTDFNYIGGQSGLNLQYPKVYAPIAGVVSFTGGSYGAIKIKDADGNSHEILHTSSHVVSVGAAVAEGDEIGAMGGQGPNGATQYPRHVHYQMKGPTGTLINPENWWNEQAGVISSSASVVSSDRNFQFPIRRVDGKQFTDIDEVYMALEAETSGHYLLGSNMFWHGGIHITDKSAPQCVLDEAVRCVADGEVVAYRLNDDYLESVFGDNEKKLKYSNSFCLVRHEYKSAPNTEEGSNKGKQNTLNFYSLYMHLLPYKRYPLSESEKPTPKVTMVVNDFRAYDVFPEVSGTPSPGKLSTGTKLEVLEEKVVGNVTYARGKILSGSVKSGVRTVRGADAEVWFAYLKDGAPYQNSEPKNIWKADKIVERLRPNYWQGTVKATAVNKLDLYGDPALPQNGQPVGPRIGTMQLIPGSVVEFESKDVLNLTVNGVTRRMAKCTKVCGDLARAGTAPPSFWACVENQRDYRILNWTSLTPTRFDAVEAASTGIKAGDPIGYLGLTENLTGEDGGVASNYQVHVEIFTTEAGVNDFLKNVAGLKSGKQYLHLAAGAGLKKKSPATDVTLLKNLHAVDLSKAPVIKEGTEDWYEVSVIEGGQPVSGLVKKAEAEIVTQHDWEKRGFQIVEESNATAYGFLDPKDTPQFFRDLFAKIDTSDNGEVDPGELTDALKNAETRDQWTKLIAYHPTEWKDKADAPKWSKLDQLLESSPKTLKHEKERISKYVFWEELAGKAVMVTDVIWHFHPVAFLGGMIDSANKINITVAMLKNVFEGLKNIGEKDDLLAEIASQINENSEKYKLDTALRLSHFFAQVRQEIGSKCTVEEDFTYASEGLKGTFGYFSRHPSEADIYGYSSPAKYVSPQNQIAIANRAYGGRLGNGNIASGDGWKYRGRGLKHLTARANYEAFTTYHKIFWSEDVDFIEAPDILHTNYKYSVRSGVYFWLKNNLFLRADEGAGREHVDAVTRIINRDTDSYAKRWNNFERIYKVEKIFGDI